MDKDLLKEKIKEHEPKLTLKKYREEIALLTGRGYNPSDIWRFFDECGLKIKKSKIYYYLNKYPIREEEVSDSIKKFQIA